MQEMRQISIVVVVILFIAGCVASSQTVKPSTVPEESGSIIQAQAMPATPPIAEQPVAESVPQIVEQVVGQQQIEITYAQITNLLSEFVDIQPVEDISGTPRFLGTSDNGLVTLEIIGSKDNISQASMKLVYPKDIVVVDADLNKAMLLRFLRNAAPEFTEWPSRVDGIITKFAAMDIGVEEKEKSTYGEKVIETLYNKNIDSVTVTVKHK